MTLFRRRTETLNEQLLREAGLDAATPDLVEPETSPEPQEPPAAAPPLPTRLLPIAPWLVQDSAYAGGRALAPTLYDAVAFEEAPEIEGDRVEFVTLPDGSVVVFDEDGDADISPLAAAVERELPPPYHAWGVRQTPSLWAVSASAIQVAEFAADGETLELAAVGGTTTLTVDSRERPGTVPQLEAIGRCEGADFAVQASRIDGDLWEVTAAPL